MLAAPLLTRCISVAELVALCLDSPLMAKVRTAPGACTGPQTVVIFIDIKNSRAGRKRKAGQAGTFEILDLLNAFVTVCNTVAYAHSHGISRRPQGPERCSGGFR